MKKIRNALFAIASIVFVLSTGNLKGQSKEKSMESSKFYDFTMKTIDGKERPLSTYKGKVLLVVNVASKCGFTPQYKGLEEIFEKYKKKGFMILGFPSNDFLWQEPGTDDEIKQFCSTTYNVSFDMFSKISVKGKGQHPLYAYLTKESAVPKEVKWNFNKFLINKDGTVVAYYPSNVEPTSAEIVKQIESLLSVN